MDQGNDLPPALEIGPVESTAEVFSRARGGGVHPRPRLFRLPAVAGVLPRDDDPGPVAASGFPPVANQKCDPPEGVKQADRYLMLSL